MNMNVCLCVGGKLCIRVCSPHWDEDGVSSQPEGEDKRASCVCVCGCVCVRERESMYIRSQHVFTGPLNCLYTLSYIRI